MAEKSSKKSVSLKEHIGRLSAWGLKTWEYLWNGVWLDTRNNWKVTSIKTVNLTARSFMSADLQSQSCAMTYRTMLAIVPALALLFAIGRGFGFQNLLQDELYHVFPSQQYAIKVGLKFVDSYLAQASEGIFVGVGLVFLLWTLISLVSNMEDTFNKIWHVSVGRTIWRKITDYLAIFLILPILMICASGLSLMMSTTLRSLLPFDWMSPAISLIIESASWMFICLFFAGTFMMIPNTKVKFVPALIAGVMTGSAYQVLQWLFLSGQLYVAKYNAIYGSFSFLPLLLLWLQLVWLFVLVGSLICYAIQNVDEFSFFQQVDNVSYIYQRKVAIAVMAVIAQRFEKGESPLSSQGIATEYQLPVNMVDKVTTELLEIKLITRIEEGGDSDLRNSPFQPAESPSRLTVGKIIARLQHRGDSDFIPGFSEHFKAVESLSEKVMEGMLNGAGNVLVTDIPIEMLSLSEDETKTVANKK